MIWEVGWIFENAKDVLGTEDAIPLVPTGLDQNRSYLEFLDRPLRRRVGHVEALGSLADDHVRILGELPPTPS